jgi:PAS domain S-box-containing protein
VSKEVNDEVRLAALRDLAVLDTEREAGFDDIVHLAAHLCAAPVALVSLIESRRQWFKAGVGLDVCETPIEQSVCAHGLGSADLLIIPDLTADPRTAGNTLVTGAPFIRFYAGAPLQLASGQIVGMLCVIDMDPRPQGLSLQQRDSLAALARQVVATLEARSLALFVKGELSRGAAALAHAEAGAEVDVAASRLNETSIRLATEAGQVGTFDCDMTTNQVAVSPEFCRVYGLPIAPSYDASAIEALIVDEDAQIASSSQSRRERAAGGSVEYRIVRPSDGQLRWVTRRADYIYSAGAPVRFVGIVQDSTAQHLLNGEIAHRLKNTLALVQAIASSTLRDVAERDVIDRFTQRLRALAVGHDLLTQPSTTDSSLAAIIEAIFQRLGEADRLELRGPTLLVGPQSATTVSMVMHELATNALKHGCLRASGGYVEITWTVEAGLVSLTWAERCGPEVAKPTTRGFGARLIGRGLVGSGGVETWFEKHGFVAKMTAEWDRLAR